MQPNVLTIPHAQAGPIPTELLETLLPHAHALRDSPEAIEPVAGHTLVMVMGPLIEELIRRRRAMDVINDLSNADNVFVLSPGQHG